MKSCPFFSKRAADVLIIVLSDGRLSTIAVTCAGVFDFYSSVFLSPTVSISSGNAATGPWTKRADLTHGGRRDWGAFFGSVTARYWRFDLGAAPLSQATQPEVAYLALGAYADLPGAAARQVTIEQQVEVNGSQATRYGEERAAFACAWQHLDATEHGSLVSLVRALGGAYRPVVVWPRITSPGGAYAVRIGNALSWSEDLDLYDGHGIDANELERVLRV
jgi:hypothetical protein